VWIRATAAAVLATALLGVGQASAATFVVTKTADTNGACAVGDCSLREAVKAANASDGDDAIVVPSGTYALTGAAGEDAAASGDLDVTDASDELLIAGAGAAGGTTISGGGVDRVFDVLQFAQLELRDVLVTGGSATAAGGAIQNFDGDLRIRSSVLQGNGSTGGGGAIYSFGENRPRVAIDNSTLSGNTAAGNGGAILNEGDSRLAMTNSTMSGNQATVLRGGALYNQGDATATIVDSTVSGNTALLEGGGLATQNDSSLTVVRTTVASNQATTDQGGGIWAQNSTTVTIVDSTLSANKSVGTDSTDGGGAIWAQNDVSLTISGSTLSGNSADRHGGAIYVRNFVWLTMQNSTVAGNAAGQSGGGIYAENIPVVQITGSTIAGNSAAAGGGIFDETVSATPPFQLRGTIVAGNTATGAASDCGGAVAGGAYASFGFNLDATGTCDLTGPGDIPNGNAGLGPLAFNGGPTQTLALLPGSRAIDAGGVACAAADQRGAPRPQGAACDIGAFEAAPAAPPAPPLAISPRQSSSAASRDTTPPAARLVGKKTQKLGKQISVRVECGKSEDCIAKAAGFLRIQGAGKGLSLKPSKSVAIRAGDTATLTLRVPRKARAAATAALLDGKKVRAPISVRVADAAGNERPPLKRTLRLT
jgi:CSLREA domain-containing protein